MERTGPSPRPALAPSQIQDISALAAQFVSAQRSLHLDKSSPLDAGHCAALTPFFSAEALDRARFAVLGHRLPIPPFYPSLKAMGFLELPDFSRLPAMTFVDVIVFQERMTTAVLFHEMVHVVHYHQLGLKSFCERYVKGFLEAGTFEHIPLEAQAFELAARFESRGQSFSVDEEVRRGIASGKI